MVVLVAVAAGAVAFLARPGTDGTAEAPPAEDAGPTDFRTPAFSVRMPPGWDAVCIDQSGSCSGVRVQSPTRRSALVRGSGTDAPRISIDRTPASAVGSLPGLVDTQDHTLAQLDGYRRTGPVRTHAVSPARRARAFPFRSSRADFRRGMVYVFKGGKDFYVVTATASSAAVARELARTVATSLRTSSRQ
jgi:hypothetical protein